MDEWLEGVVVLSSTVWLFLQFLYIIYGSWRPTPARSEEISLKAGYSRMESYKAEQYCIICYSLDTSRCSTCGAVAYCSKKCQKDHWEQHKEECGIMANFKESNMDYLAHYPKEQCRPFDDAGKSTDQASESRRFPLSPENRSVSKQERRATALSKESAQFTAIGSNEEFIVKDSFVSSNSVSKGRAIHRSINGLWQKPQPVDDGGEIKEEASKLEHLFTCARNLGATAERPRQVTPSLNGAQNLGATTTDRIRRVTPSLNSAQNFGTTTDRIRRVTRTTTDRTRRVTPTLNGAQNSGATTDRPRQVTPSLNGPQNLGAITVRTRLVTPSRNRASQDADHGVIPYPTFKRSSSSCSTDSSSTDSSDSDAMSSLHGLD